MKPQYLSVLRDVLSAPTAPFHESAVERCVIGWARRLGVTVAQDRYGNLVAHLRHGRRGKGFAPWALAAHMDHPGFISRRQRGQTVWGEFMGGVGLQYFPGARLAWHTQDGLVKGAVQSVQAAQPARGRPFLAVRVKLDAMRNRPPVPPGTLGMWDLPAIAIRGRRLASRACDDLVGLCMAMCAIEDFARSDEPGEFYLLATRAEEVGLIGAIGACRSRSLPGGVSLAAIETSSLVGMPVKQGSGVIVRVGDKSSVFDPLTTAALCDAAGDLARQDGDFRWQRALMSGGTCESTAYCQYGYPATGLCLALGNYHNQGPSGIAPETIDLGDFVSGVKLLRSLARRSANAGGQRLRKVFAGLWNQRKEML